MDYKRKKNTRQRGNTTHGYGSMKKNRGAGNRGGRGNAGSGKRGDSKKPTFAKNKKYFGKYGFKVKSKKIRSININDLEHMAKNLKTDKIDLGKLNFDKLLGKGKATKKYEITVESASAKAVEAIKNSGGEVILPAKKDSKQTD